MVSEKSLLRKKKIFKNSLRYRKLKNTIFPLNIMVFLKGLMREVSKKVNKDDKRIGPQRKLERIMLH